MRWFFSEKQALGAITIGIVAVFGFGIWRTESDKDFVEQTPIWIEETGSMEESSSDEWWVNSGAYITKTEHGFATAQGELPLFSLWRPRYFLANPRDTDNGAYPQNIFRLVNKNRWENGEQTVYVRIQKLNISESPERDAWSGIFLFQRYEDGDNVYYAGLRQDGAAIIKKKINGVYYTMAYARLFGRDTSFHRDTNPNLIPGATWIGLRTETATREDGSIVIRLFMDKEQKGNWELVAEAIDDGARYGGAALAKEGYGGIRSDFMDMEFRDYELKK